MGDYTFAEATTVGRLRLKPDEVEEAVLEVRALLADRGRPASLWEIGGSATPPDLVERLIGLGLCPDGEEPHAAGMALCRPPDGRASDVVVTKVETVGDFRTAVDIACEAFEMDETDREHMQSRAESEFEEQRRLGQSDTFLAWLDGQPVGRAGAGYSQSAVTLWGGATLPSARGRGAYRALVAARWEEAVHCGKPALVTQAGKMSRPILRSLGFEEVAEITRLSDRRGA